MEQEPTKQKTYQEFVFVVEEMTAGQADKLMHVILKHVESQGLFMGGGCQPTTDLDYPPFLFALERFEAWLVRIWKKVHHGQA